MTSIANFSCAIECIVKNSRGYDHVTELTRTMNIAVLEAACDGYTSGRFEEISFRFFARHETLVLYAETTRECAWKSFLENVNLLLGENCAPKRCRSAKIFDTDLSYDVIKIVDGKLASS